LLCRVETLTVRVWAEDDQILRTNRNAKAASLAALAVHLDFPHIAEPRADVN
jgi:hypothetical protein